MDNWRDHAACRNEDPDLFFPIGTSGPSAIQTERAKALCQGCPVRERCLDRALDTEQTLGIWGGTTETERRALRRRRDARRTRDTR